MAGIYGLGMVWRWVTGMLFSEAKMGQKLCDLSWINIWKAEFIMAELNEHGCIIQDCME